MVLSLVDFPPFFSNFPPLTRLSLRASRHMSTEATIRREPITAPTTRNVEQSFKFWWEGLLRYKVLMGQYRGKMLNLTFKTVN
jgi:hypothetical protein